MNAITSVGRDIVAVGGRAITDVDNMIILMGLMEGGPNYATLRLMNATAGYQVPVGKVFKCKMMKHFTDQASSIFNGIGYGDNDVGISTATVPTNPVWQSGSIANAIYYGMKDSSIQREYMIDFEFIAEKYPCCKGTSSTNHIQIYGYLEDA